MKSDRSPTFFRRRFAWATSAAVAVAGVFAGASLRAGPAAAPTPASLNAARPSVPPANQPETLPTGKKIQQPPLDSPRTLGNLPMNLIPSPGGGYAIATDMSFHQDLTVIRTDNGNHTSHITFGDPTSANTQPTQGLYYGLVFDPAGALYAAQGQNDTIAVLSLSAAGVLAKTRTISTKAGDFPSGLATDNHGHLYVVNNDPQNSTSIGGAPGSMAVYDSASGTELGRYAFPDLYGIDSNNFPLAVAVLSDGSKAYVSSQRDASVYVLDTHDPAHIAQIKRVATGSHPIYLLLDKEQKHLYVANAHSDTISVIDPADDTVAETLLLRPERLVSVAGATPTGMHLSPDEKVLFVTLGDLNAVAVVAVRSTARNPKLTVVGFIPVGWYPTGVVTDRSGTRLLVVNAKGNLSRIPNPGYGPQYTFNDSPQYDLNLILGTSQSIPFPNIEQLKKFTTEVLTLNDIAEGAKPRAKGQVDDKHLFDHRLDHIGLKAGKIKHVMYVIKENRTYDQVLGDLPQGNGDASLAEFGKEVTPNLHALASRFVLLDNYYVCSEASGDGWPWLTQSMASEYVIKNLPYNYSGRGRNYDFEGQINGYPAGGFPAKDPDGNPYSVAFPNGAPPIADVSEAPGGHIWDMVEKAKLSYRNYGCFCTFGVSAPTTLPSGAPTGSSLIPDNYPGSPGLQPPGHDLAGRTDFDFRRFDGNYADSDAPANYGTPLSTPTYGKHNAVSRFSEWNTEFKEELAQDSTGGTVPHFQTIRIMNDHTQGLSPGKASPRSHVADNDYAIGQLVEAVSNSPIWDSTAIFVIEDDTQDGPDHVDCHRSPCFVISPWIKKSTVDSHFHNQDSVLKTMEMILGIPPLTNYDAIANPILDFDVKPSNAAPYKAILPAKEIIAERNPTIVALEAAHDPKVELARLSEKMDLVHPDSAPARALNEVIWKGIHGMESQMPEPLNVRPLLVARAQDAGKAKPRDDDDD